MTNIFNFPLNFNFLSPEEEPLTPEESRMVDGRMRLIDFLTSNTVVVASDVNHIQDTVAQPAATQPEMSSERFISDQQMRDSVIGTNLLVSKALEADTSQAEWIAALEQMAKDEADSHEFGLAA